MRNILIALGILAAVALLSFLIGKSCQKPIDPIITTPIPDSVLYWKNKAGENIASQKGFEEQFALRNDSLINILIKDFNTKLDNLKQYQIINLEGNTEIPIVPGTSASEYFPPDSSKCPPQIKSMSSTFMNPYYTATVRLGENPYMNLKSWDTLTTVWKTVREGNIFNRKTYLQIDIRNADTSKRITGMKVYRRLDTEGKKLFLTADGRLLYMNKEFIPMAGMELNRNFGIFNIGVGGGKEFLNNTYYGEARLRIKFGLK